MLDTPKPRKAVWKPHIHPASGADETFSHNAAWIRSRAFARFSGGAKRFAPPSQT